MPNVSPAAASSVVSTASPFVSASSVNAVRTAVLGTATNTFLGNLAEVGALPSLQQLIADTVQAPTLAQVQAAIAAAQPYLDLSLNTETFCQFLNASDYFALGKQVVVSQGVAQMHTIVSNTVANALYQQDISAPVPANLPWGICQAINVSGIYMATWGIMLYLELIAFPPALLAALAWGAAATAVGAFFCNLDGDNNGTRRSS